MFFLHFFILARKKTNVFLVFSLLDGVTTNVFLKKKSFLVKKCEQKEQIALEFALSVQKI
jgi:hypothetical protein